MCCQVIFFLAKSVQDIFCLKNFQKEIYHKYYQCHPTQTSSLSVCSDAEQQALKQMGDIMREENNIWYIRIGVSGTSISGAITVHIFILIVNHL